MINFWSVSWINENFSFRSYHKAWRKNGHFRISCMQEILDKVLKILKNEKRNTYPCSSWHDLYHFIE
jgi:NADPH-dependent 7-cyano-7-deazaguanine reductase QueF